MYNKNTNNSIFSKKWLKVSISLCLVCCIFLSSLVLNASAYSVVERPDGSEFYQGIFDRQWLYEYGVLSSENSQYNLYMPIADTEGKYYYRCDPYSNAASLSPNTGAFTVSDWGRGTLTSGSGYSYSKRIGFLKTIDNDSYLIDTHHIATFMMIPKNTSVKVSFVFHLTGTVSGWADTSFAENMSLSFYSGQQMTVSDKYCQYVTNVENSIWFIGNTDPYVGVAEGTPCTRFIITVTVSAGNQDVYINSVHLNLNRIKWNGDLPLDENGTMFMAGLVVDNLTVSEDPAIQHDERSFFQKVSDFFSNFWTNISNWFSGIWTKFEESFLNIYAYFGSLSTWLSDLGDRIGGYFDDLWNNIESFFDGLADTISGIWGYVVEFGEGLVSIIKGAIVSFFQIIISLHELSTIQEGKELPNV